MASNIPPDTLRRLKYPVLAHVNSDGSTEYVHDSGIQEGIKSSLSKDFSPGVVPGYLKEPSGPSRDSQGRFVK